MSFQIATTGNGSNESSTDSSTDGEDQDEPSSVIQERDVEDVLSNFRKKWQKELETSPKTVQTRDVEAEIEHDFETKAKTLFLSGVEMEKAGQLYEAIQFYRRAVQLVPDIEFRLDNLTKNKPARDRNLSEGEISVKEESNESDGDNEEIKDGELLQHIQKKTSKMSAICVPKNEQKSTHISVLPMEMMLYILRWVVTSDLDLRSLEMFSMVCRGFYLCARDSEVWRLACLRLVTLRPSSGAFCNLTFQSLGFELWKFPLQLLVLATNVHRTHPPAVQRLLHRQDHLHPARREQFPRPVLPTLAPSRLLSLFTLFSRGSCSSLDLVGGAGTVRQSDEAQKRAEPNLAGVLPAER
jgi:hypothetical protein